MTKNAYYESKVQRGKEDYEDLLRKFETTVKTLSKNNKYEYEREMEQRLEKMKEEYGRKYHEKDEMMCQQRKEYD